MICYVEEWQTPEDLNRQIRSIHYTHLMTLVEVAAKPPQIRVNWIAEVRGLEYLEMVKLAAHRSVP